MGSGDGSLFGKLCASVHWYSGLYEVHFISHCIPILTDHTTVLRAAVLLTLRGISNRYTTNCISHPNRVKHMHTATIIS